MPIKSTGPVPWGPSLRSMANAITGGQRIAGLNIRCIYPPVKRGGSRFTQDSHYYFT